MLHRELFAPQVFDVSDALLHLQGNARPWCSRHIDEAKLYSLLREVAYLQASGRRYFLFERPFDKDLPCYRCFPRLERGLACEGERQCLRIWTRAV